MSKILQGKIVIATDTYWCLSSDLCLKIPFLGWLDSSSMFNNFSLTSCVTLTQSFTADGLKFGIRDNLRDGLFGTSKRKMGVNKDCKEGNNLEEKNSKTFKTQ